MSSSDIVLGRVTHPYHPERSENAVLNLIHRLRHLYILGATGYGKTKLIESLIRQDIKNRSGSALVEPHGDLTRNLLSFLANKFLQTGLDELGRRLILIDPSNRQWAIGFNPLEATNGNFPAMLELLEILKRFWGGTYWGPRMDELLRNTLITLCENNLTLLEARPLLINESFRRRLIDNVSFGEVKDYWLYRYNPLSDRMQAIYREPVLNKVSAFVADPSIYRIIGQSRSTVNFREAFDQGKWLFLNLNKGQLKENIRLLGTLFLTKIKQAALSRADTPEDQRRPFFVFIDEFQNFIGNDDLEEMLSETRKYRLGLTLAHQNLDQLPRELRSAILGNVGTEIFFRMSHHDASQISSEMDPKERHLIERRLIDLRVGEAWLKIKGENPRLLKTPYVLSIKVSEEAIERIKRASFQNWARPIHDVEREIEERRRLWMNLESTAGPQFKGSRARQLREHMAFPPEGRFEEGQSEW